MLTIDQILKYDYATPYYSGTGFIKLKTNNGVYRFYCEEVAERTVDKIHSHTQSFNSQILKGTLKHVIYDITPVEYETDYKLIQGACTRNCMPTTMHENVITSERSVCDTTEGNSYQYNFNDPHNVELVTSKVITLKTILLKCNDEPIFVIDKRIPFIDPWDTSFTSFSFCAQHNS